MPNENNPEIQPFMLRFNGSGIRLPTLLKIIILFTAVVTSFAGLTYKINVVSAQVTANASQNELDKRTALIVQHQQKQIDTTTLNQQKMLDTLANIQQSVTEVSTKLDERTMR